jgi:glucose/arabinose dehydrogenase
MVDKFEVQPVPAPRRAYRKTWLLAGLAVVVALAALMLVTMVPATARDQGAPQAPAVLPTLALDPFASGFQWPVGIVSAGDERLFIIEKFGKIRIVGADGTILEPPFLDITDQVRALDQEQGLLGLVFTPGDLTTFYIYYINLAEEITIARYRTQTGNINRADATSAQVIFSLKKPYTNHNAGDMAFGPDGYLYVAVGDGGGGGDPDELAQNLSRYFGKILRINVTGVATYTIPADNPFALDNDPNTLPEIWAYGMRNPWRMTFDRATNDIYFGEVGEATWEEVNIIPANSTGGLNFGWDCYEGNAVYETAGCGPITDYTPPIFTYRHVGQCTSVTGGYVYRGTAYPNMVGHYLFGDFCFNRLNSLIPDGQGGWNAITHTVSINQPAAFGQDTAGELYVSAIFDGIIYKIRDTAPQPTPDPNASPTATNTPWPLPTSTATTTATSNQPTATATVTATPRTPTATPTVSPTGTLLTPTHTATGTVVAGTPTPTSTPATTGTNPSVFLPLVAK